MAPPLNGLLCSIFNMPFSVNASSNSFIVEKEAVKLFNVPNSTSNSLSFLEPCRSITILILLSLMKAIKSFLKSS